MRKVRSIVVLLAAVVLAGCVQTLTKPNELHAALLYAPQPADAALTSGNLAASAPCEASGGVRPTASRPELVDDFAALPGMTLQVTQANARLTGASDTPLVASWSWTLPQAAGSPCATTGWSQRDLLMLRTLIYGARLGNVTMPPDKGSAFDPLLWAMAVHCASIGATVTDTADCLTDTASPRKPSWAQLQTNLLDPVVARLRLTIGNGGALPTGGAGAASTLAGREQVVESDFPTGPGDPRVRCGQPEQWYATGIVDPIPAPCDDALKILRLRGQRSAIPVLKCPPPYPTNGTEPECYLTLLETGDRLQLNGPKLVGSMASPAFDLAGARPGSGYDYNRNDPKQPVLPATDSQRPIAGEAYQGFVDFDLLIPIWIDDEKQPLLVPVDTTLAALHARIGRTIVGVKRLAGWFPASVTTIKKAPYYPKPSGGRVTIGLGPKGPGDLKTQKADWAADMLVAPGDIVMVK